MDSTELGDTNKDEEVITKCFMFSYVAEKSMPVRFPPKYEFYKTGPIIGKSSFGDGKVHVGQYTRSGELVALKKYNLESLRVDDIVLIENEIVLMRKLAGSDYITSCLASFSFGNHIFLVLPFMEYKSCLDVITGHFKNGLSEILISRVVHDVLKALKFLHEKEVIHRSIRASHILLKQNGHTKLTGFRYACTKESHQNNNGNIFEFLPNSVKNLKWLAPEILQQSLIGYNEKSDIYSLGITICEMANGVPPFSECCKLTELMMVKLYSPPPPILDSSMKALWESNCDAKGDLNKNVYMTKRYSGYLHCFKNACCQTIPKHRPNIGKLLAHQLFAKINRNTSIRELVNPAAPIVEKDFQAELVDIEKTEGHCEVPHDTEITWEF